MKFLIKCFTCIITVNVTLGFFARSGKDGNWRTKTHYDITAAGIFRALSKYIIEYKGVKSVNGFFGDDEDGKNTMLSRVFAVRKAVAETQINRKDIAYFHCHADQILLAHNFVKSCKQKIIDRINDNDELLRQIGECLYTVQSFYSNTNWVEMFGDIAYEDFGINDLMATANQEEDTCKDIGDYNSECKDNILVHDKLTSGYHHARGNPKPAKPKGSTNGKCSHGGPDDESRKLVARCGINKDSLTPKWSPHHYLHSQAYRAALQATENFLIANGTGVLHTLKAAIFDKLFNIRVRENVSLAIAIDYTSSMTDDIAAVKEKVIELLTKTIGSTNEPADYVLSLFHDPASYHHKFLYTNGYDMVNKVKSLQTVPGVNPDCPELASAGILAAIELARSNSPLLVFTDADAKDAGRVQEVINAANAKNITITSLLTNQCGRRRRALSGHFKRSTLSFFEQIATATGGEVYETDKENIGNVLNEVLQDMFPSSEVVVDSFSWSSIDTEDKAIVVDSTITVLKISVTGASSDTDVDVFYANGTMETYSSGKSTRIFTSEGETIISIQGPPASIMKVRRNVHQDWNANVTGQSSTTVEVELLEKSSDGNMIALKGSPLSGRNYSASFVIYNLGVNGTCNNVSLVSTDGQILNWYETEQQNNEFDTTCIANFGTPADSFKIRLHGHDNNGYHFIRKVSTLFNPTNIEMNIYDSGDEAILNKERSIGYEILNTGISPDSVVITITDTHGFVYGTTTFQHDIKTGESSNGTFIVKPTNPSVIFSYTVSASVVSSGTVQQTITRKVVVTDVERPDCTVSNTIGICGVASLNTANCSSYNWTAITGVTFSGTTLESISSTVGMSVTLSHQNITGLSSGPLTIEVIGDCCAPTLSVNVIDVDGFISQCHLSFSNGETVQSVEKVEVVSTPTESSDDLVIIIVIVVVVLCLVVITVIVVGLVLYFHNSNIRNKIYQSKSKPDGTKKRVFNVRALYHKQDTLTSNM